MILIIGYIIVTVSVLGGFIIAGGHPIVLMHVSEFVIIGGMAFGVLVVASPKSVMVSIVHDIKAILAGGTTSKAEILDLFKLLYEMFMLGRRNGLVALDEHLSEPRNSPILNKYESFLKHNDRVEFFCNALRPIVDGKVKPDQLEHLLEEELAAKESDAHGGVEVLNLVGDSLPGIGIVAAVLGIINTMGAISDGPEAIGHKVAAALTGTFLGILFAYGYINPMVKKIQFMHKSHALYFQVLSTSITAFAKGVAPLVALESARRSLSKDIQPGADELEGILKAITSGG
jgi:chemotaxis protein MotA